MKAIDARQKLQIARTSLKGVSRAFAISAITFCAAVVWATWALIQQSSRDALDVRQKALSQLATAAEGALNRSLLGADLLLTQTAELIDLLGTEERPAQRKQITTVLRSQVTQNLLVREISLIQTDGTVIATSDPNADRLGLEVPPAFLAVFNDPSVVGAKLSSPVASTRRAERVLFFGRPILMNGFGRAVAVAEISIARLTASTIRDIAGDGTEITLERNDGELLASHPPRPDGAPQRAGSTPTITNGAPTSDTQTVPSRITGDEVYAISHPAIYADLIVTSAMPRASVLASVRTAQRNIYLGALILIVLVVANAFYWWRQMVRNRLARDELAQSKATVDQALESMSDGFLLLDHENRAITWNRRFVELHPWLQPFLEAGATLQRQEGVAVPAWPTTHHRVATADWIESLVDSANRAEIEQEASYPGGLYVRISGRPTPDGGAVLVFRDVTERRLQDNALRASKSDLEATLNAIPDALYELDDNGVYVGSHVPAGSALQADTGGLIGKHFRAVLPLAAAKIVNSALDEARAGGVSFGHQIELPTSTGTRWYELSVARKEIAHAAPTYIVISRDVTQSRAAAAQIEKLALFDPLTDLPNRRMLLERLHESLHQAQQTGRSVALMFIDLDNFKTLNDSMRHDVGDKLLVSVAKRLRDATRPGDTVGRLGGDEFVVVLAQMATDSERAKLDALARADNVLQLLRQPYDLGDYQHRTTASIGVAVAERDESSVQEILKRADIAMYAAKAAGRNAVRAYSPEMDATLQSRLVLERDLRTAAASGQLVLHYQRQVNAAGETMGAEALLRWNHPTRGLIAPGDFIAIAEDVGLMPEIGRWVMHSACEQMVRWRSERRGVPLPLAINVSASQLAHADFKKDLQTAIRAHGIPPRELVLEVTEHVFLKDDESTIRTMVDIAKTGVRFSIDDFGTGHASLAYLTRLPLSQLKIAQPFVERIGEGEPHTSIVQAIIAMAASLNLEVIAEGVERQEQRAFLQAHGCGQVQGFLVGRPVPASDFFNSGDASQAPSFAQLGSGAGDSATHRAA